MSKLTDEIQEQLREVMEKNSLLLEKAERKNLIWKKVLDALKAKQFSFDEIKLIYPPLDHYMWDNADYHPPMKLSKDQYWMLSWYSDLDMLKYPRAKLSYYNEEGICLLCFIPKDCSGERIDFVIKNKFFNPYM
jgi:hypothetical protein